MGKEIAKITRVPAKETEIGTSAVPMLLEWLSDKLWEWFWSVSTSRNCYRYGWNGHSEALIMLTFPNSILHMRAHSRKSQDSDSSETTIDSPLWLDSSAGNSAESNFDSDSSEISSSTATSKWLMITVNNQWLNVYSCAILGRSSSRTRNYEAVPTKMKPETHFPTINGSQARASHQVPKASMQRGSLKIFATFATPRSLPDQALIPSPIRSTTKEAEIQQINVCDGNR
jgi:hypothetical protein